MKRSETKVGSTALLACPFCGSKDVAIEETDSGIGGLHGEYYGTCWHCYAETSKEDTKQKARRAWNRRHTNAESEAPKVASTTLFGNSGGAK